MHASVECQIRRASRIELNWLYRELPRVPARERIQSDRYRLLSTTTSWISKSSHFKNLAFYVHLNYHGLLQEIERRQISLFSMPCEHQDLVSELQSLNCSISSGLLGPDEARAYSEKRNHIEFELYCLYPELQLNVIEPAELSSEMSAGTALVTIQHYCKSDNPFQAGDAYSDYIALILLPGGILEAVDLGCAKSIENAIHMAHLETTADEPLAGHRWTELSNMLIAPLLAHLEGVKHWYITLDGELHKVPFHVLTLPGEPDRLLTEIVTIQLLTSGRDLLKRKHLAHGQPSVTDAMVVADPAFDHAPGSSADISMNYEESQSRSRDMGTLKAWAPLHNSAIEGMAIAKMLGGSLHTGTKATTITVQQAQSPRILHIATHGFFLPNQHESLDRKSWWAHDGQDLLARFRGEDPMLRSGLVFAGANHPVADPAEDDGYLTALEAIHLNLQGTELVTLSACDAGSGDIRTGEGVYGLQRALIVAGARSMLLSLWPVPDEATCEFMVRFYTLLKEGKRRFDALVTVQREFRQHTNERWRHPYYWGAWQLIGDGGPIEGL